MIHWRLIMQKMFWVDLEMTGLDVAKDVILEVAVVVTNLQLEELARYEAVVFQTPAVLAAMDPWCIETHGKSGLTAAVSKGKPLKDVEQDLIKIARDHFPNEKIILCGNSVGTDKKFLDAGMPLFARHLHYRIVDVSSWKEIFNSVYGMVFQKRELHRAVDDILESIGELAYYQSFISAKKVI